MYVRYLCGTPGSETLYSAYLMHTQRPLLPTRRDAGYPASITCGKSVPGSLNSLFPVTWKNASLVLMRREMITKTQLPRSWCVVENLLNRFVTFSWQSLLSVIVLCLKV